MNNSVKKLSKAIKEIRTITHARAGKYLQKNITTPEINLYF